MGTEYRAGVFFGICAKKDSPLGKKLDRYIEEHGGTPAPTEVEGVEISMVGSQWNGQVWLTAQASGSAMAYGQRDELKPPHLLSESATWRPAIERFLRDTSTEYATIGWYFHGDIW
jgi:hypothetical protein